MNLAPNRKPISEVLEKFNSSKLYDISFEGLKSDNGFKISIVGKTMEDVYDLYNRLHEYLIKHNIAHKIATKKRVESNIKEQNRKLVTIYVPNDADINKLLFKIEYLLKGYNGWQDIRLPHKGYEVYSGGISFRNDRDDYGNYIPAKRLEKGGIINNFKYSIGGL